MQENEVFDGILMEDSWLTLEQVASACAVEPQWLLRHIGAELFPHAECVAGVLDELDRLRERLTCLEHGR